MGVEASFESGRSRTFQHNNMIVVGIHVAFLLIVV